MSELILAINPGSTSTKLGLFDGVSESFTTSISHETQKLKRYSKITDQCEFRLNYILDFLSNRKIELSALKAVVGRGGLLKSIPGGTYKINEIMLKDLKAGVQGEHASNLGGLLAHAVSKKAYCPAYIVDPVVVDELTCLARFSGIPELKRKSIFHALNQKAVARKYARDKGCKYKDLTLIIAHLGGGISVGIHHKGNVIDVNNALSGEGPFSPNRSGGLPAIDLINMCYSGNYSYDEMKKKLIGNGGVIAYLNTNDIQEVEKMIEKGNERARLIFKAMAYQVSKEIGSLAPITGGNIDAIILTGGIAYSKLFTAEVKKMVDFIASIYIYPGEEELRALAAGAYRVLTGEEDAKIYR